MSAVGLSAVLNPDRARTRQYDDNITAVYPAAVDEFSAFDNGVANDFGRQRHNQSVHAVFKFARPSTDKHARRDSFGHGL